MPHKAAQRAVENVLLVLFISDPAEGNEEMSNVVYQYVETILASRTEKEELYKVFDRGIVQ